MTTATRVLLNLAICSAVGVQVVATAETVLYASAARSQELYTLSPIDASASLVGNFAASGNMAGLAYDSQHDILFGSTTAPDNLYSINRVTGEATLIGPFGFRLMHALAFDELTGVLYGARGVNAGLYQIDPMTGGATLIGTTGFPIAGLSFDPVTHTLYGCSYSPGSTWLLTIDPATGNATQIAPLACTGISFNPETGVLYGISNGALGLPEGLYTINTKDGSASLVGTLSLDNPLDIQFVVIPEPAGLVLIALGMLIIGTPLRMPALEKT